jgi:hypothetical protein
VPSITLLALLHAPPRAHPWAPVRSWWSGQGRRRRSGTPRHPGTGVLPGVSVSTDDPALGRAILDLVGESVARVTLSRHYTLIIAAL